MIRYPVRDPLRGTLPAGDVLLALHARHSHRAIQTWKKRDAKLPVVVAISGTDLYIDLPRGKTAAGKVMESLQSAHHIIGLHRGIGDQLPPAIIRRGAAGKNDWIHFIPQSATPLAGARKPLKSRFRVLVVGYLRSVKDPFLLLEALQHLPQRLADGRKVEVVHLGGIVDRRHEQRARKAMVKDRRWRWLGAVSRSQVRSFLANSHLLVHPSLDEGGANIISEALVAGIPIVASDAPGNVGLLGEGHPGIFPRRDGKALAEKILHCATDRSHLQKLQNLSRKLARQHRPEVEISSWKRLLRLLEKKVCARPDGAVRRKIDEESP